MISPACTRVPRVASAAIEAVWRSTKSRPAWSPWPGTTTPVASDERGDRRGRRRPLEGVAVRVERHGAVLEQVAREQHVRAWHGDHDVVIGVAAAEVAQLDLAPTDLDRRGLGERLVGRIDDDLVELAGDLRVLGFDLGLARLAGPLQERDAPLVTPDPGGPEEPVPERVIPVAVRVHDDRDRVARQLLQVGDDLARLPVRRAGVDDERLAATEDRPRCSGRRRGIAARRRDRRSRPSRPPRPSPHASRVAVARAAPSRATLPVMPSVIGRVTAADGTELRTRHWPAVEPWASLLLVHGLGEHSGRYEHVGEQLSAGAIDVHAYDQRGQGGSDGRRGHVDRWSDYHDDLGERLATVRAGADGPPGGLVRPLDGRARSWPATCSPTDRSRTSRC